MERPSVRRGIAAVDLDDGVAGRFVPRHARAATVVCGLHSGNTATLAHKLCSTRMSARALLLAASGCSCCEQQAASRLVEHLDVARLSLLKAAPPPLTPLQ